MYYKVEQTILQTQLDIINNGWFINDFKPFNPDVESAIYFDSVTIIRGFGYIPKMWISEKYITDFTEIVDELPMLHNWHDETCSIQVVLSLVNSTKLMIDFPELGVFCKEHGLYRCEEYGYAYIYCNFLLAEHKSLLDSYHADINTKEGYHLELIDGIWYTMEDNV